MGFIALHTPTHTTSGPRVTLIHDLFLRIYSPLKPRYLSLDGAWKDSIACWVRGVMEGIPPYQCNGPGSTGASADGPRFFYSALSALNHGNFSSPSADDRIPPLSPSLPDRLP